MRFSPTEKTLCNPVAFMLFIEHHLGNLGLPGSGYTYNAKYCFAYRSL
jgi:hypothetical protein